MIKVGQKCTIVKPYTSTNGHFVRWIEEYSGRLGIVHKRFPNLDDAYNIKFLDNGEKRGFYVHQIVPIQDEPDKEYEELLI